MLSHPFDVEEKEHKHIFNLGVSLKNTILSYILTD